MSTCRAYLVITLALMIGSLDVASAQEPGKDFAGLHDLTKAGDTVYVTSADGRIRRWTQRDVPLELVMQQAGLSVADVRDIARERADSVWNGALLGLAVAATPWLIVCAANDWCYYNPPAGALQRRRTAPLPVSPCEAIPPLGGPEASPESPHPLWP